MSDGTVQDATRVALWESSNAQLAPVSPAGLVTPIAKGEIDVRANYMGVSSSIHLAVAPAPVTSLTIAGAQPSGSFQLTATAKRADNSTVQVTSAAMWQSSDPHTATVSAVGYVTVLADGRVDISATYEGTTATVGLSVSAPKIYSISGTITDAATQKPIANARVQVLGGPFATTDANGKYVISAVAAGRVLVEISADGYDVVERDVTVDADETLSVALQAHVAEAHMPATSTTATSETIQMATNATLARKGMPAPSAA
jgi:hypothetical protein